MYFVESGQSEAIIIIDLAICRTNGRSEFQICTIPFIHNSVQVFQHKMGDYNNINVWWKCIKNMKYKETYCLEQRV